MRKGAAAVRALPAHSKLKRNFALRLSPSEPVIETLHQQRTPEFCLPAKLTPHIPLTARNSRNSAFPEFLQNVLANWDLLVP